MCFLEIKCREKMQLFSRCSIVCNVHIPLIYKGNDCNEGKYSPFIMDVNVALCARKSGSRIFPLWINGNLPLGAWTPLGEMPIGTPPGELPLDPYALESCSPRPLRSRVLIFGCALCTCCLGT